MTFEPILLGLAFFLQSPASEHLKPIRDEEVSVDELILKLGHDSPAVRDEGQRELIQLGFAAADRVSEAFRETRDPEVRERAGHILRYANLSRIRDHQWAKSIISSTDWEDVIKGICEAGLVDKPLTEATASLLGREVLVRLATACDKVRAIRMVADSQIRTLAWLLAKLFEDGDARVRMQAVWALGMLQERGRLRGLLSVSNENDPEVCLQILRCLCQLQLSDNSSWIAARLSHPDWRVREEAVKALVTFKAVGTVDAIAELLTDQSSYVRASSAFALAELGARDHADKIAALLWDPEAATRVRAIEALGELRCYSFGPDIALCLGDSQPVCRWAAARTLAQLQLSEYVDEIEVLLDDQVATSRIIAADAIAQLRVPDSSSKLVKLLTDRSSEVRRFAIMAFRGVVLRDADNELIKLAANDQDSDVRFAALEILCSSGSFEFVLERARLGSMDNRWLASKAIGRCRIGEAVPSLRAMLQTESDESVRCVLQWSIGSCLGEDWATAANEPGIPHVDSNY
jgi:HEAT repeat protein